MEIKYINDLSPDRWEDFKNIRIEAFQTDPLAFSDGDELFDYSEKDWRDRLQKALDGKSVLVFAEIDGKLVGIGLVYLFGVERYQHNGSLQGLFVSKEHRGKGIGARIINKRIEILLDRPEITQVICEIFSSQVASLELHKKLEFEETGKVKDFVKHEGNFYDSVFLQKNIR